MAERSGVWHWSDMLRFAALALAMVPLFACGDDGGSGSPGACGWEGEAKGDACQRLSDCGGPSNESQVSFCDNCPFRADVQICNAGVCETFDPSSSIELPLLSPPASATGAAAAILVALEPVAADGTRLTCEGLLSSACGARSHPRQPQLNATNARFVNLSPPFAPGSVYPGLRTASAAGADKLLWVRLTTETQGKGEVLAEACVEGIQVPEGGVGRAEIAEDAWTN